MNSENEPSTDFDWNNADLGCYADGALGHRHLRNQLAELVEAYDEPLAKSLRGEMSDDAWEENEALDILNSHTAEGLVWEFIEGELFLSETESDEAPEYERDEDPDSPEEGDWTTNDHQDFVQYGRVVLTLERGLTEGEMWANILRTMSAANFFPNVWFISDHGNAHLMRDPRVLDPKTGVLK